METNMVFGTVFGQVTMHSLYVVVDMRLLFEFLATQRTVEGFFSSVNQHMLFQSRPRDTGQVAMMAYMLFFSGMNFFVNSHRRTGSKCH
jgi:hypothetical protein